MEGFRLWVPAVTSMSLSTFLALFLGVSGFDIIFRLPAIEDEDLAL